MSTQDRDPDQVIAELRRLVIQRSRLLEISVTLNSTLDLNRVLQFITDSAAELLDSEAASILLFDEKSHSLNFAAVTGTDPESLKDIAVPIEGSIAGAIFRDDRPLILNQVRNEKEHFQEVDQRTQIETRSLIGVPMQIRGRVTGVLEAINKHSGAFDENDLQALEIMASQAAVAINNARLLEALKRAYDELDKLDRMKSEFIAIASHELRTPLGIIVGYATILQEEARAEASEHAAILLNTALRMRALIEDMTNMNLLQVGSPQLNLETHPLQEIARQAHDEVADLIEAKGQRIDLDLPADPLVMRVDAPKMRMALTNLLNNAMRFSPPEGHILLQLETVGSEARFKVSDQGIGIPGDELEEVFDRFFQVGSHMTRKHGGLGLGLSIVKAIAEAHQGRAWVESEGAGQGACFNISLPLSS